MEQRYAVEVSDLEFRYKSSMTSVLKNVNLKVKPGEIVAVIGLSGSGKTSLMYALNGIIPKHISGDYSGTVNINGLSIENMGLSDIATVVGTVFQDPDTQIIFSDIQDEIAFGPENLCISKDVIFKRMDEIIKLLDIERLRGKNPKDLSGGEKQLVVLASVLSLGVQILILDECMSQIDQKGKYLIKKAIKQLKEDGKTIIMVEHEEDHLDIADSIYLLEDGNLTKVKGEVL